MKASPPSPFVVRQRELLLELLVVVLDPPPQLDRLDQPLERRPLGQRREKVPRRFGLALGPLDEQPLLVTRLVESIVPMRRPHAPGQEAPAELALGSFSPGEAPESVLVLDGQVLDRHRPVLLVAPKPRRRPPATAPRRRRQRPLSLGPDACRREPPQRGIAE